MSETEQPAMHAGLSETEQPAIQTGLSEIRTQPAETAGQPIGSFPVIRVDADACPVNVRIILEHYARRHQLGLIFYIDDSHELSPTYGEVRCVGRGHDAVDLVIVNQVTPGDLVVTQDYGLAALVLARRAFAIHPSGLIFDDLNIDQLLFERHLAARGRRFGERSAHARPRQKKQDLDFDRQLQVVMNRIKMAKRLIMPD